MEKTRREFLGKAITSVSALATISLAFPLCHFLSYNGKQKQKAVIPLDSLTEKVNFIEDISVFIFKTKNGFEVLDAHCTHMGCILNYNNKDGLLECPCHGSEFKTDGERVCGPAKKPLKRLSFKISDAKLIIG